MVHVLQHGNAFSLQLFDVVNCILTWIEFGLRFVFCYVVIFFLRFSYFHSCVLVVFIGIARGGPGGNGPPKCLAHKVILCFERRYSKQNSVIHLKSNIPPPKKIWAGYATGCICCAFLWTCVITWPQNRGLKHAARGPHVAHKGILCEPQCFLEIFK